MQRILVCIHGWGGSKESFTELRAAIGNADLLMLTPDLPGFGNEPDPATAWHNDDYADWVCSWIETQLKQHSKENATIDLLGHSHGGRISIKLAARQASGKTLPFTINHLYLCAAAGIRHPRHVKRVIGLLLAKTGKFFLQLPILNKLAPLGKKVLYKLVRVHDYEKASPIMQDTLRLVTQEDLTPLLTEITVPTDLFWGTEDGMTPYSDALTMHKLIADSALHSYPAVRHAVHRVCAVQLAKEILNDPYHLAAEYC